MIDFIRTVEEFDLMKTINHVLSTGQMLRVKTKVIFPKFNSWFEFTLNPQMDHKKKINSTLYIDRNINEQQSYENQLKQLIDRFNAQQRAFQEASVRILLARDNERSRIRRVKGRTKY